MSVFTQAFDFVSFFPDRAIGPFTAKVTIEEIAVDSLNITQHPVEQGASITDHAYKNPALLRITAIFTDSQGPLAETYANLLKLQEERVTNVVVTGKRQYENMLIQSLGQTTDALSENVLSITFDLQEIFVTSVEVATVPERSKQLNPGTTSQIENAGQKSTQPASNTRTQSIARIAVGAVTP